MSDWTLIKVEHIRPGTSGGTVKDEGYINPFEVASVTGRGAHSIVTMASGKEFAVTERMEDLVARIKDAVQLVRLSGAHN